MLKVSIISTRINQFCLHWIVVSIDPFLWKACKRIKISTYLTNFPNYCNSVKLLKVSTISTRINQFCHWIIVSIDRFKNQNFYAQTILPNFWRVKKGQSFRVRRTLSLSLSLSALEEDGKSGDPKGGEGGTSVGEEEVEETVSRSHERRYIF